ncbi:MAG: hypothetical protein AAB489_03750 [Patescibacteria group bacterium]
MHNIFTPQRTRTIVVFIVVLVIVLCVALIGTRSSYLLHSSTISVTVLDPLYDITITAVPEKTQGSAVLTFQIYPLIGTVPTETRKVNVNASGVASQVGVFQATPGIYRLLLSSSSHLKRKKLSVLLLDNVSIDFTLGGSHKLYAGDVTGDNAITASDVSQIAGTLRSTSGGEDLNNDGLVNGMDLTMAITNLGRTGDEL